MLTAFVVRLLMERRAAKLRGPHHQRPVQHPALLQVREQPRNGLIDGLGQLLVIGHVAMGIPVGARPHINQFQETHPALRQPPGDQALPAEAAGGAPLQPVQIQRGIALAREIKSLGRLALHAKRRFKGADARVQCQVRRPMLKMVAVELAQQGQLHLLQLRRGCRRLQIRQRLLAGDDMRALMAGRKEVAAPGLRPGIRSRRCQHHEGRQVVVLRAETVAHPRTRAGPGKLGGPGMRRKRGLVMAVAVTMHCV